MDATPHKSIDPLVVRSIIDAINREDCSEIFRIFDAHPEQKQWHTPFGGATWLGYAAGEGRISAVKALTRAGLDINQGSTRDNIAPICNAAGSGHTEIVDYLLACGAHLDTSKSVTNPLIWTATDWRNADDTSIVKLLLKGGIDSTVYYPYSGRTKTKQPLDAIAKSLLWGTPAKAGTIAAWNARGNSDRVRPMLEAAMAAADTHLGKYPYGAKKRAEMGAKREISLQKAEQAAFAAKFD